MSLLDLHGERTQAAAPLYEPPMPKGRAWGTLTGAFRGAGEGLLQLGASAAESVAGFGDVLGAYPEILGARSNADSEAQRRRLLSRGVNMEAGPLGEVAKATRSLGREFRPDETAGTAEQLLYGFARGATKIVGGALAGGVPGVLAVSGEEAYTQTGEGMREGLDFATAAKLGLVQGAGLALAVLPAAGATFKATAALYLAGGPGGFVAQQALTKQILADSGYDERAQAVDLLDPVGLAVSALIPAPFAALGLRAARRRQALASLPDLPAREADSPGQYPREVVDAALVMNLRHHDVAAQEVAAGRNHQTAVQHQTALARAEQQLQNGEPVSVADVAPATLGSREDGTYGRTNEPPTTPAQAEYLAAIAKGDEPAAIAALEQVRQAEGRTLSDDDRAAVGIVARQQAAALDSATPASAQTQGAARDLKTETIALRKQQAVLDQLLRCLNG